MGLARVEGAQPTVEFGDDELLKKMPPCVAGVLKKGWAWWQEYFVVATFLKENGYPYSVAEQITRKYLTTPRSHSSCGRMHPDGEHYLGQGCQRRQNNLASIYDKIGTEHDYDMPSCEKIRMMGLCPFGRIEQCEYER